jgi:hypothetical protein
MEVRLGGVHQAVAHAVHDGTDVEAPSEEPLHGGVAQVMEADVAVHTPERPRPCALKPGEWRFRSNPTHQPAYTGS